jgi:hypothetical protein
VKEKHNHRVSVRQFMGFSTDVDPQDMPPGLAEVMLNCTSADPGVLESRPGYTPVTFESITVSS